MKGFTLIETTIVLAIMGILAAIAIPVYQQYNDPNYVTEKIPQVVSTYVPGVGRINSFCLNGQMMYEHDNMISYQVDANNRPISCN